MQYLEDIEDSHDEPEEAQSEEAQSEEAQSEEAQSEEAQSEEEAPPPEHTHFVSFDLGSESSSAYLCMGGAKFIQLDLQSRAKEVKELFKSPELYMGHRSNRPSRRIRTRFRLKDGALVERKEVDGIEIVQWPESHARLSFFENGTANQKAFNDSVFQFFRRTGESKLAFKLAPNPKIPFQMGADEVIPRLEDHEENLYTVEPRDLILHLCTQLINNFAFSAPELAHVKREKIHLTLTVPNVYSITHSQLLRNYVGKYLGLDQGSVDLIYESDAVAFFALRELTGSKLNKANSSSEKVPHEVLNAWQGTKKNRQIITLDVGKGTIDLSLIEIKPPAPKSQGSNTSELEYHIKSRTGRTWGGGKVSYILVEYFNKKFNAFLDIDKRRSQWNEGDFIYTRGEEGRPGGRQDIVISILEEYVEELKKCINEDYSLDSTPQLEKLKDELVNKLHGYFSPSEDEEVLFDFESEVESEIEGFSESLLDDNDTYDSLRLDLYVVLTYQVGGATKYTSSKTRKGIFDGSRSFISGLLGNGNKQSTSSNSYNTTFQDPGEWLYKKLNEYVEGSISLYDELRRKVEKDKNEEEKGNIYINRTNTFVLVAGQAAQFKPLQKAIRSKVESEGLPLWYLDGERAKQACALGAAIYSLADYEIQNQGKIHGGYFFSPLVHLGGDAREFFTPVKIQELESGDAFYVKVNRGGMYNLFYTTIPLTFNSLNEPDYGELSLVGGFKPKPPNNDCNSYHFLLQLQQKTRHLLINGEEKEVNTFGDLNIEGEDVFSKVWPDYLKSED